MGSERSYLTASTPRLFLAMMAMPFEIAFRTKPVSFRDDDFRSAEDELRLLAGPAGFLLLGHEKRTHAFHAFAADALMQGRVVTRADHGIVGMDAVAEKCGLDFAGLDLDGVGPARKSIWVGSAYCVRGSCLGAPPHPALSPQGRGRKRPGCDDVLQIECNLDQFIEECQADAFLPMEFLAELLVGPLRVGGEAVEASLHRIARLGQRLLEHLV